AALVLAPALAARIAAREGRVSEAERQATAALRAAHAFGLDTHPGAVDAYLALAGALIDRNELADATAAFRRLDEVIQANPFTLVYQVLVRLEKVRVAAALNDFDNVFATLQETGKLIDHLPRSALRCLVDAAAARWHLEAGQTRRAEGPAVARLARAAAESLGTESGTILSVALGSPPPSRSTPRQPTPIFTERELSVLQFLPTHLTNAEIAGECFMSVNTVKTHLKNIYAKLGVTSRAETVERARLLGLL
ncbi:MAG: LuxR C-terminal-related transcriptional regulator, partial [Streptosporangiaceae bacterium]